MGLASCCDKLNLDHTFAYTTAAQVKIKDKRLGITRLFLLVSAFVWVVVVNVVMNKGWARVESVEGVVAIIGTNPTVKRNGEEDCYCYGGEGSTICGNHSCFDRYSNFTDLPYCTDSSSPYNFGKIAMKKNRCIRIDAADVMLYSDNSIFLATQIKYSYQTFNNEAMENPMIPVVTNLGNLWKNVAHPQIPGFFGIHFYVSDISKYTLLLKHGIKNQRDTSKNINNGVLRSKNKALCRKLGKNMKDIKKGNSIFYCDIKPKKTYDCRSCKTESCKVEECGYDMFTMKDLLLAGETESDEMAPLINPLDKPVRQNSNIPLRDTGLVMKLVVTYTDEIDSFPYKGEMTYYYTVDLMTGAPNVRKRTDQNFRGQRNVYEKHGVSVQTVVDGHLHEADLQTLLVQMTSILGLTSMIGLTIEFIMLKVLNVSGYYRAIKFSESVEYSRLQKLPAEGKELQELSSKEIMKLAEQSKKSILWQRNNLELQSIKSEGVAGTNKNSWVGIDDK